MKWSKQEMRNARRRVLGIDPGRTNGAAVLLEVDGKTVLGWFTWQLLKRKGKPDVWRITNSEDPTPYKAPAVWAVGGHIFTVARLLGVYECAVVVEGLFVPRGKMGTNPQSVIPLAEAAGELIGGLRMVPELRPLANAWRHRVLGLPPRTKAAAAELYAMQHAPLYFDWPDAKPPPTQAERGALAEAAFIARFGWLEL